MFASAGNWCTVKCVHVQEIGVLAYRVPFSFSYIPALKTCRNVHTEGSVEKLLCRDPTSLNNVFTLTGARIHLELSIQSLRGVLRIQTLSNSDDVMNMMLKKFQILWSHKQYSQWLQNDNLRVDLTNTSAKTKTLLTCRQWCCSQHSFRCFWDTLIQSIFLFVIRITYLSGWSYRWISQNTITADCRGSWTVCWQRHPTLWESWRSPRWRADL